MIGSTHFGPDARAFPAEPRVAHGTLEYPCPAALREARAEPIETVKCPFDPTVREMVGAARGEGVELGTVVWEVHQGRRLGEDRLRPTEVVAERARESDDPWR